MPDKAQLSMNVPVDFDRLIYILVNSFSPAVTEPWSLSSTFILPANSGGIVTIEPTEEKRKKSVLFFVSPIRNFSTYHDPDIEVTYNVYGSDTWVTGLDYRFTRDFSFDVRVYHGLAIQYVKALFINGSAADAYITIDLDSFLIEKSFFDRIVLPVLKAGVKHIEEYADWLSKERWR